MLRVIPFCFKLIKVQIEVEDATLNTIFREQLLSISQLIGNKKLESVDVISKQDEEGFAVSTVNSEINVHLLVKVISSSN